MKLRMCTRQLDGLGNLLLAFRRMVAILPDGTRHFVSVNEHLNGAVSRVTEEENPVRSCAINSWIFVRAYLRYVNECETVTEQAANPRILSGRRQEVSPRLSVCVREMAAQRDRLQGCDVLQLGWPSCLRPRNFWSPDVGRI